MASTTSRFASNLQVEGDLIVTGELPTYPRSSLQQDNFAAYPLPLEDWRIWDAYGTGLPATSATDDLGLYTSTFGTGLPYIGTGDVKALGAVTRYARLLFCLPPSYVAGETVQVNFSAGMLTTIADTLATVDVEVYKSASSTLVSGSDLVTTAATTINSVTFADTAFEVTATTLSPGDWIDIRVTVAVTDAATGTAVIAALAHAEMLLDIKG